MEFYDFLIGSSIGGIGCWEALVAFSYLTTVKDVGTAKKIIVLMWCSITTNSDLSFIHRFQVSTMISSTAYHQGRMQTIMQKSGASFYSSVLLFILVLLLFLVLCVPFFSLRNKMFKWNTNFYQYFYILRNSCIFEAHLLTLSDLYLVPGSFTITWGNF